MHDITGLEAYMRRRLTYVAALSAAALAIAPAWSAGQDKFTLHPNGFGEHSQAAWKAGQGLPDSHGSAAQALYFQKDTATSVFAAGVARVNGVEGKTPTELGPELAWWWRKDGRCGGGAPRWNLTYENGTTFFVGCMEMEESGQQTDAQGRDWERRSIQTSDVPDMPLAALKIVFDEGSDLTQGFVYLDDIQVGSQVWSFAGDNSGNNVAASS